MVGQPTVPPTPASTDLSGQTIIITGGNAGLGLEAAREYLTFKTKRVILACRSISRGEEAAKNLASDPNIKSANPDADITVMELDLDDLSSVRKFSDRVKSEVDALHVLLLNAGLNYMEYQVSKSGHERVFQVNYLSNVLLALELLPLFERTASEYGQPARLTFVGSYAQVSHGLKKRPIPEGETIVQYFDNDSKYSALWRYSDSKLMIAAFTQEMARHVSATKLIVNNVCPGFCRSGVDVHLPFGVRHIVGSLRNLIARSTGGGARTLVYATSVIGENSHGKFISNNEVTE